MKLLPFMSFLKSIKILMSSCDLFCVEEMSQFYGSGLNDDAEKE